LTPIFFSLKFILQAEATEGAAAAAAQLVITGSLKIVTVM
jgi:hypothetical protein